jgi:phage shock protein PspC (stress-responsive transcriptional regulator)
VNKTENVSIGRHGFVCEQGAYRLLQDYLERAKKSLHSDPDKDDILADLELSMAGHLSELSGKLVVDEPTAKKVIDLMGEVSVDPENESSEAKTETNSKEDIFESFAAKVRSMLKKPLYKDKSHKVVDGVCSGLANSLEVDALWVRLAFVLLLILTRGGAVVLYFILSIAMKDENSAPSKTAEQIVDKVKEKFVNTRTISRYEQILRRLFMGAFRLVWGFARFIAVATLVVTAMAWATVLFYMLSSPREVAILGGNISWLDLTLVFSAGLILLIPLFELITSMFRLKNQQRVNTALWSIWALSLIVAVASFANVFPKVKRWALTDKPQNNFVYVQTNGGEILNWCFSPLGTCKSSELKIRYESRCNYAMSVYNPDDRVGFMRYGWFSDFIYLEAPATEEQYCDAITKVITRNGGIDKVIFADNILNDPVYTENRLDSISNTTKKTWSAEYMTHY